jgi:predicted Zn-dependent peptidase
MQKYRLSNGLKVLYHKKKGNSVVVQVMITMGSNHEAEQERGISHFLEHMLFEGTEKRPTNLEITNEIEKIGGDFNAYTTNERTCFYIKVLKKHFNKAVEVLADILSNPLFKLEQLEKEKLIVLKEIDMVHDEPSYYQWILLQKNLFTKHPCKNPTYGKKSVIKGLTPEKVRNYFKKYYVAQNMVVGIVGDVPNWKKEIVKNFKLKKGKKVKKKTVKEPPAKKVKVLKEKKDIVNTYTVYGFKTVPKLHPDSYVLEVINGILGRGQSGRIFNEVRTKRGLAYDVGTQNIAEVDFGFFAIYASVDKKNVEKVRGLVLEELKKLREITAKDLKESKDFIEGNYLLDMEDSQKVADQILFYEQIKDAKLINDFITNIKKVTLNDVKRVAKKYFKNYTMAILEGR